MRSSSRVRMVAVGFAGLLAATPAVAAPVPSLSPAAGRADPSERGMVFTAAAKLPGVPRTQRAVQWQRATSAGPTLAAGDAWSSFVRATGVTWQSAWDRATQAPIRVWGEGLAAPGAMASPQVAEAIARRVMADHLALWAPGASPQDFRLVANDSDGDQRTLGFVQTYQGLDVVGGQMSFRFKHDRLFVIASEAIPNVTVAIPSRRSRLSATRLRAQVGQQLAELGLPATAQVVAVDGAAPVVLPIIGDHGVLGFRVVVAHQVEGATAGRWTLYADPLSGEAVAYESQSFSATGRLLYRVVSRYPGVARIDVPAARTNVTVGGVASRTAADGTVTWSPDAPQPLVTSVSADLVNAVNKADTSVATATLSISPGGDAVWDASGKTIDDAQVNVIAHVNRVKDYVRTFAPTMPTLDDPINANVNIDKECNASFDGKDLNFFRSSTQCENTGLISDVVYHEFGHAMHFNSIIPGVGRMDGAFSEGLSDFLAVIITEDPGMGRGFFFTDEALRHMDPMGREPRWPDDIGEIHKTGIIFGSAMWDLRKALIAQLGREAAVPLVNRLFYAAVRRASDIPTTLVEILAADDDDGNLANGTPNECAILDTFGRHGLRVVSGVVDAPGAVVAGPSRKQTVSFDLLGRSPRCATDVVTSVDVFWLPGPSGTPQGGKTLATPGADPDHWTAELPLPTSDAMSYSAVVTFANSIKLPLPDNMADLAYQLYEGETVTLACANMDQDPLAAGWTASAGWAWGPPAATGTTDPHAAFTGSNVLAIGLGSDYLPDTTYTLTLPAIDVGQYSDVRLQYRRWLAVEDSEFDQATITANGKAAWINASEQKGNNSALQHVDREWRFHDVPLSSRFRGNLLTLGFSLVTDGGLEFGGWAIDDLCVVANPSSICGDGMVTGAEECDDADQNSDAPNHCRLDCKAAACGDGVVDRGEECDDGAATEQCASTCLLNDPSGGCCDAGGNPAASLLGSFAVVLLVMRRRRPSAA